MKKGMQQFSRSVIIPIKFMAVMGLFMAFSVLMQLEFMPGFVQSSGAMIKAMMDAMLNNLSIIFCIGIASSMAKKNRLEAGILASIVYLMFLGANNAWLTSQHMLAKEGAVGLYGTGQNMVLGFQVVDMNVFLGMILGVTTAYVHNKFGNKKFIDVLSIYGGPRLAFIIMIPITLAMAISFCYIWPIVNDGINSTSSFILGAGAIGVFLYGFGNRFLIPTGLHHLLWMPFCFTAIGGTATVGGKVYAGAVNIFYAEMANVGSITSLDPSIRFTFYGFSKVFASIPIALALIHMAKKKKRDEVKGMVMPGAFVGTVAGITEPLDFAYLFAAPQLWLVHSLLTGLSEALMWEFGIRTFINGGVIDTAVSNSVFSPGLTKIHWLILFGLVMAAVWYFTFVFMIKKLDLKTPGREDISDDLAVAGADAAVSVNEAQPTVAMSEDKTDGSKFGALVEALGGKANIEALNNCFTRLRIDVLDGAKIDKEKLKLFPGQKGVVVDKNNIQIIIGMGVQAVRDDMADELGFE